MNLYVIFSSFKLYLCIPEFVCTGGWMLDTNLYRSRNIFWVSVLLFQVRSEFKQYLKNMMQKYFSPQVKELSVLGVNVHTIEKFNVNGVSF